MTATRQPADGLYVGLISGTSADGIDAALCRFGPQPQLLGALTHPWPDALRSRMLAIAQSEEPVDLDAFGRLDSAIGDCFADAVQALLAAHDRTADDIRAIGSHGQTLRHRPDGEHAFTLQLGNPWLMAERCGIDTVADFRRADMAAGGQGAPLMSAFHAAVLAAPGRTRGVLNLGGIGNLTVLGADGSVRGFDTGPANGLMDAWCQRHTGQPFDSDGVFAAQGKCDDALLAQWLSDPYFALPPPKSTGREYFHLEWLESHPRAAAPAPADVQATLLALTVRSVADAVHAHAGTASDILVCGGGVHNRALMDALAQALAPREVHSTAMMGVDPDYMEAMGFAWLARQHLEGLPGNLPSVTGARGKRLLGSLHRAPRPFA
ncbi:MAG TPA: anhydro-N-acetylmuramic acid kinase [Rhodanobacteraceae bacterium]|nr:anhydro-N-acetylmuramic acid kinase [Rhodanobacteraceae bacterium]